MVSVIIVAGGKGLRMGAEVPKQFLPIGSVPIIMRTIKRFRNHPQIGEVIVVLPSEMFDYWKKLCDEYDFTLGHSVATGGSTRFESVKNGLSMLSPQSKIVMVHDAVRPFVSDDLITRVIESAREHKAVVPVVEMIDSVREVENNGVSHHLDRAVLRRVQTPQGFLREIIDEGYCQEFSHLFTDDASVIESLGYNIFAVDGLSDNIKITNKIDLAIAKYMLEGE